MSGSVNNLIALQAGQGVPAVENPLAQQQQYAQARQVILQSQNAMNQNKLFQSQQKQGQLAQQAIDPSTGQFSPSKFNMLLGQSPGAGIGAQDAIAASQTQSSAQQTQAQGSQKQLASGIGGLLTLNGGAGPTYGQTTDFLKAQLTSGAIRPQSAQAALIGMPSGDDPQSMATRTHMIQTIQQQMASSQEQLTNAYGTAGIQNRGGTAQPIVQQSAMQGGGVAQTPGAATITPAPQFVDTGKQAVPTSGGQPIGPGISTGLPSAAALAQPVTGPASATGAATTISLGQQLARQGLDSNGNPIPNPAFASLPAALRNPNAPPKLGTPMATGLGPAATNAMAATGTQSSGAYQDISAASVKAQGQRALLQNMAGDASQFTTGPGADNIKAAQSILQRISPRIAASFGVDPAKLAANEDLDKVGNQLADAMGAGSDARLAVNQGANPSSHNTPAGLQLILAKLTGNTDYQAARGQLAAQYQQTIDPTGANSRQFEAQVGQQLDPRVFQFNRLNGPQQAQYLSEMPGGAAKDAFKQNYFRTKAMGVLPGG